MVPGDFLCLLSLVAISVAKYEDAFTCAHASHRSDTRCIVWTNPQHVETPTCQPERDNEHRDERDDRRLLRTHERTNPIVETVTSASFTRPKVDPLPSPCVCTCLLHSSDTTRSHVLVLYWGPGIVPEAVAVPTMSFARLPSKVRDVPMP